MLGHFAVTTGKLIPGIAGPRGQLLGSGLPEKEFGLASAGLKDNLSILPGLLISRRGLIRPVPDERG